mmetsp:Transcript_71375/g.140148  ORF Transcript_71375/g.140148 Transcript_71375/m.140148 type:complete len:159 (+) Transcript_71375:114-590(+)|eukprot:CAMPEP_0170375416 /NCGR_PEP_ID=MMETSP0117_2-20130122/11149_1 /TAXON_ID=400756 /ORGANISM="Durinskia baltica, Strain CSIRO CS-38" /LENGTH=158 /DNA_ID=CAMNT_0010630489 /DNA_START=115 /DNA_END=591 /DNA_ORIENTATION=-
MSKAKGKAAVVEEAPPEPVFGTGEFAMPDGSRYSGEFMDNAGIKCRHGNGSYTIGQEIYTGAWENDMMNGEGEYRFGSGAVYQGTFRNNLFEGLGTYTFPEGTTYTGSWRGNKMHGYGTHTSAEGLVTTGEFVNGIYKSGERSTQQEPMAMVMQQEIK